MTKGDLPKFIEEAVKWRVLWQTIAPARGQFADWPPDEVETLINEAAVAARLAVGSGFPAGQGYPASSSYQVRPARSMSAMAAVGPQVPEV
jgi:hypothetical protein